MAESFVVYVDEAGDTGFKFLPKRGSSQWLCLSALVVRKSNDLKLVEAGREARKTLNWKKDRFFHFRDMKHEWRRVLIRHMVSGCPMRTVSVLCHKPSIAEVERFQAEDRLYFYLVRLLLERVSWLCRDSRTKEDGDGRARLIFSHRRRMSYGDLREYLLKLQLLSKEQDVRIEWDVIDPELVQARGSRELVGLQFADAVASSFFTGLNPSGYGLTEPQYALALRPTVYKHKTRSAGYGIKIYPPAASAEAAGREETAWLSREFL